MTHTPHPKTAYTPPGHTTPPARFSPGVRKGNIVQVSGQVGFLPAVQGQPSTPAGPGLREQSLQTFANIEAVLTEAGAGWEDVIMVRVYLTDTEHFAEFNALYDEYVAARMTVPSARTTVYVGLPQGLLVEIDAQAVCG